LKGVMLPLLRAGNSWTVRLSGASPGGTYQLQRATNLFGPWIVLTNITAASDGTAQTTDAAPPSRGAFYRAASQ